MCMRIHNGNKYSEYDHNYYFVEVTAIEEEWLPVVVPELCTFSSPMDTPPPRYDPMSDKIMCHMTSSFGMTSMK